MDRQEIRFVAQLGDQRARARSARAHGDSPPASATAAALRPGAQIARRRLAGRDELVRILVAGSVQRKTHALEYRERFAQQLGRITPNELVDGPQAALGIRMQLEAELVEGTLRRIAVSVSCSMRRSRQCMCTLPAATNGTASSRPRSRASCSRRRSCPCSRAPRPPRAAFEALLEPTPRSRIGGVIRKARQPQQQAMRLQAIGDVVGPKRYSPLGAARRARLMRPHSAAYAGRSEAEATTANRVQLSSLPTTSLSGSSWQPYEPHDSCHGTLVGQRQAGVTELCRGSHSSPGCEAPRKNEKLLRQCSSAYAGVDARGRATQGAVAECRSCRFRIA